MSNRFHFFDDGRMETTIQGHFVTLERLNHGAVAYTILHMDGSDEMGQESSLSGAILAASEAAGAAEGIGMKKSGGAKGAAGRGREGGPRGAGPTNLPGGESPAGGPPGKPPPGDAG